MLHNARLKTLTVRTARHRKTREGSLGGDSYRVKYSAVAAREMIVPRTAPVLVRAGLGGRQGGWQAERQRG